MDPALAFLCDQHGVFLRREAEELGYNDPAIARAVRSGEWVRVRHGAYHLGPTWLSADERTRYGILCRAALRQADTDVVLSHVSAAHEWGSPLWDVSLREVDLTRVDGRTGRRAAGVHQHRGVLVEGDVEERHGVPVVSATRTALELTTALDLEHALVELDYLLHHGLTTPEKLRARYARMSQWPHSLRTDLVLRLADGRSESVGESRMRYLFWTQRVPPPTLNHEVFDPLTGKSYRVDFAWPELGVFVEFDGKEKYLRHRRPGESLEEYLLRERDRQNRICELTGWTCLRVGWSHLGTPVTTAARVRRALGLLDAA
ncbi:type IV toxin-antitoxin system AbiEi family antitoxin domain-containing protein [Nocardioides nanhaiensis]|uniref:Type IV toxin-antitoxin system AbiEi family antitoxin domain-containing protein n=1 Tax=Nocardioides nanhaiensis TaxID=1476871 RepID=A0ABP8WP26_9ACTN